MPILNLPNKKNKNSSSVHVATRRSYLTWYWSALALISVIAIGLIFQASLVYRRSIMLTNKSNSKMIEKTGIEMIAELNKKILDQARQVAEKKNSPLELPPRARNIFVYDGYVELSEPMPIEIIAVID